MTSSDKAPERIWAWDDITPTNRDRGWSSCDAGTGATEYVRADLHDAAIKQRDELQAEVERLREMLLAERALSDRLCGALEYIDDYCLSYPDLGVLSGVTMPAIQDHEQAALQRKEGNE